MQSLYRGHRFPHEIISCAVWLYYRFALSSRDVEDLLAERGITVSYEAIRYWCLKVGRPMLYFCAGNRDDSATSGTSMNCS